MAGLNHVDPAAARRSPCGSRPRSTMTKLSVGPMDNNAYLLRGRTGSVLIDAADEPERLLELIGDQPPEVIVTTHRHHDHWQALAAVAEATEAQLVCGRPDLDAIATGAWLENLTGVWDGDVVAARRRVAGRDRAGRPHAGLDHPGLSRVGRGRSTCSPATACSPAGRARPAGRRTSPSLMDDLESKIFGGFGDDTVVHPGHGDDTTLATERPQLGSWRARGW